MTSLDCNGYAAESLDLSKCVNLTELDLSSCDQLTSLDLSTLDNLTELELSCRELTNLDLTKCANLTKLELSCKQLTNLDLTKCVNLTELSLKSCEQLASLDLTKCVNLTRLFIDNSSFFGEPDAQLTSLDLTKCVNLTSLTISSCDKLTSLDLSKLVNLTELDLSSCDKLTSLDLSKLVNLTKLSLTALEKLTSLDLSTLVNLTELSLAILKITSLDLSKCVNLTELILRKCEQLTSLDPSKLVNLTTLSFFQQKPTSLDLSKFVSLTKLSLGDLKLTSLDLSKLVNLTELNLPSWEKLTSVDLSGCKKPVRLCAYYCKSLEVIRCNSEAVPKLNADFPVVKEEEGDVTLLINKKFAKKRKAGAKGQSEGQQANPDECPYTLMLCANERWVRATELFGFDDEDAEEVEHIKELINSGDTMELWENYYGEGKLFAIFDLWGDDEQEKVSYKVTDENDNVIKKGNFVIEEDAVEDFGNPQPYITKDNHPKYLLLRREYRKNDTAYYKIPKDFDLEKCTFPYVTAFESRTLLDTNWMGDTRTGIQYGFRNDGVDYSCIMDSEFEDGYNDFALYEYDENRGGYNEVASTICDEE